MTAAGYSTRMSAVSRVMKATPDQVWDVLADGWLYPLWVVGASRMREVDDHWPQEGQGCTTRSVPGRSSSTTTPRCSRVDPQPAWS